MTQRDPFSEYLASLGFQGFSGFGDFGNFGTFETSPTDPNRQFVDPISDLDSVFGDFLEEEPEIPFQGALQRANLTPNQVEFFRNKRKDIFGQFQGLLDQQIRAGGAPDARFADFVGNFDFDREFNRQSPTSRFGGGTAAPITRVLRR